MCTSAKMCCFLYLVVLIGKVYGKQDIDSMIKVWLDDDYDVAVSPAFVLNTTMIVNVSIYPVVMSDISVPNMDFSLETYVVLNWYEDRLNIEAGKEYHSQRYTIPQNLARAFWYPRLSFVNSKQRKDDDVFDPGLYELKIFPGLKRMTVFYREKISFTCTYDLAKYPLDHHECSIFIQGYVTDERDRGRVLPKPVPLWKLMPLKKRFPPEFEFLSFINRQRCSDIYPENDDRNCLEYVISFRRIMSHHIMLVYIPSALIVIMSWMSFWLDLEATAPRVTLGLTSMLTLATQFNNAQRNLPAVSYMKAIDVWMLACVFMVFASLSEFSLAYFRNRKLPPPNKVHPVTCKTKQLQKCRRDILMRNIDVMFTGVGMDKMARIVFPLSFLIFNVIYWAYYISC